MQNVAWHQNTGVVTLDPLRVANVVVVVGGQEMHYYCNKDQKGANEGLNKRQQTAVEEEGRDGLFF